MGASLILTSLGLLTTAQAANEVADPKEQGPYAVGIATANVFMDDGRFVPIYVFYPVDQSSLPLPVSSRFNYQIRTGDNALGNPVMFAISSAIWEQNGIDVGYKDAPVSSHGPFPLIASSTGGGADGASTLKFNTRMASHGYVVAAVQWQTGDIATTPTLHGSANCPKNISPAANAENDRLFVRRSLSVTKMIDLVLTPNNPVGNLLSGKIDAEKIAGTGWSRGGRDMLNLIAGTDKINSDGTFTQVLPPDTRIKVLLGLDASNHFHTSAQLKRVTVPVLALGTPAADGGIPTHRLHALISSDIKFRVDIAKTEHGSIPGSSCARFYSRFDARLTPAGVLRTNMDRLCNSPATRLLESDYHKTMFPYVIAFLKTHLENKTGHGDILTPGWTINTESNADFFQNSRGNLQYSYATSACGFVGSIDTDPFKFMLRQPGITTNNASTDRVEKMFSTDDTDSIPSDEMTVDSE